MITYKLGDQVKFIEEGSKLIPILEKQGWTEEVKAKPKKKKNDDSE